MENCLFGEVKLTKNIDIDESRYSGYGIEFDRKKKFSVTNGSGRDCIICGVDMSSSVHVNNKEKYILVLGEGTRQELDDTTLTAEKNIQLILLKMARRFV